MHTIVLTSDAFQFDSCSASQVRAFGIDRGNDDPGTQTDESLLSAYKSISFEKHQITVKFYKEEQLAGGPVGVKTGDQIVARGDNCIQNPSKPGWYQISGKINGSTNGDTTTDFSQSTTSHYIYVCDCESRQEAEEKLGPPPGSDGGGEPTATPTESGGGESTATPTESGGGESTATPTESGGGESTATPTDGGGGESTATPTEGGGGESTATPTDSNRQGQGTTTGTSTSTGNTTGTANATSTGNTTGTTSATSTGNGGGFTGGGSQNDTPSPTNSGGQPGFGLVAALGALALAGLLARRQRD